MTDLSICNHKAVVDGRSAILILVSFPLSYYQHLLPRSEASRHQLAILEHNHHIAKDEVDGSKLPMTSQSWKNFG